MTSKELCRVQQGTRDSEDGWRESQGVSLRVLAGKETTIGAGGNNLRFKGAGRFLNVTHGNDRGEAK